MFNSKLYTHILLTENLSPILSPDFFLGELKVGQVWQRGDCHPRFRLGHFQEILGFGTRNRELDNFGCILRALRLFYRFHNYHQSIFHKILHKHYEKKNLNSKIFIFFQDRKKKSKIFFHQKKWNFWKLKIWSKISNFWSEIWSTFSNFWSEIFEISKKSKISNRHNFWFRRSYAPRFRTLSDWDQLILFELVSPYCC